MSWLPLGHRRGTVDFDAEQWMVDIEALARNGALDAAFVSFLSRYGAKRRQEKIELLRRLRSRTRPPNRCVALFLLERLSEHLSPSSVEYADALVAIAQVLRDHRRFADVVKIADTIVANPELQQRLKPWQRAMSEVVAIYSLSRLGEYDVAKRRFETAYAKWPTATLLEEGIRLHALRDPRRAIALAHERTVSKLRRSAFFLYMAALERDDRLDEYEAQLNAETKRRKRNPRPDTFLLQANLALRHKDVSAYTAMAKKYFVLWHLRFPDLSPNSTTLPISIAMRDGAAAPSVSLRPNSHPPTLSVVMTTFNSAVHLSHSISSILAQSFNDFELLIVDDCSNDNGATLHEIESWAARDPRIRVLRRGLNGGTYQAKNAALKEARGRFITCHDSDDFALPDRFAREMTRLEVDPSLIAVQSGWVRLDASGRFILMRWGTFLYENPASVMFRREALDAVGHFDGARTGADTEFGERLRLFYGAKALGYLHEPLTLGLYRPDSLTTDGHGAFDDDLVSPERIAYWDATSRWHLDCLRHTRLDSDLSLHGNRLPIFVE